MLITQLAELRHRIRLRFGVYDPESNTADSLYESGWADQHEGYTDTALFRSQPSYRAGLKRNGGKQCRS
jgi:hypothetical protein